MLGHVWQGELLDGIQEGQIHITPDDVSQPIFSLADHSRIQEEGGTHTTHLPPIPGKYDFGDILINFDIPPRPFFRPGLEDGYDYSRISHKRWWWEGYR